MSSFIPWTGDTSSSSSSDPGRSFGTPFPGTNVSGTKTDPFVSALAYQLNDTTLEDAGFGTEIPSSTGPSSSTDLSPQGEGVAGEEFFGEKPEYWSIPNYNPDFDNDVSVMLKIGNFTSLPSSFFCFNPEPEPYDDSFLVGKRHYCSVYLFLPYITTAAECNEFLSYFPLLGRRDLFYLLLDMNKEVTKEIYDSIRDVVFEGDTVKSDYVGYNNFVASMKLGYSRKVAMEARQLEAQQKLYDEFKSMNTLPCSIIEIQETRVTYRPNLVTEGEGFYNGPVNEKYGMDVFEKVIVNPNVPFVNYVDQDLRQFTKIYRGSRYEYLPDFDKITVVKDPSSVSDSIHITIWCGDPTTPIEKRKHLAGEYVKCIYGLVNNRLRVDCKTKVLPYHDRKYYRYEDMQKTILGYLQTSFPNLDFGEMKTEYRGNFLIGTPAPYNEMQFADYTRNYPLFAHYLYVEERKKISITHKSFDLGFRSGDGDVAIKVHNETLNTITLFVQNIETPITDMEFAPSPNLKTIRIRFMNAPSKEAIDNLYSITRRLFSLNSTTPYPSTKYFPFISGFVFPRAELTQQQGIGMYQKDVSITERYPHIFPASDYNASLGNVFKKPVEDITRTQRSAPFYDRDMLQEIQENPSKFDKIEPVMYLSCPLPDHYVVFRANKRGNFEKYPYWPYCVPFGSSEYDYGDYMRGRIPNINTGTRGTSGSAATKKGHLAFIPGVTGLLPTEISNLIKELRDESEDSVPTRIPSPYCPNSLLYAALPNIGKLSAISADELIPYLARLRQKMISHTHPALLRQEMYDSSEKDIVARLAGNEFLDGKLFYRAVEEYYDINLIMFNDEENGAIDIPRYEFFHARTFSATSRKFIFVLKSSNKTGNPQYERITLGIRDKFDMNDNITKGILALYQRQTGCYRWNEDEKSYNLQNLSQLPFVVQRNPVAQHLDDHGKAYGFRFMLRDGRYLDMLSTPTQPMNVPSVDSFFLLPGNVIRSIFGDPVGYYRDDNNTGYWYRYMGMEKGVYIPTDDVLPNGGEPHYSLYTKKYLLTENIHATKRESYIIDFLLKWLYHGNEVPQLFWDTYVTKVEEAKYNFSTLTYRLPLYEGNVTPQKIRFLEKTGYTYGGKIVFSSELYDVMYLRLMSFSRYIDPRIPFYNVIPRFYERYSDFGINKDVLTFVNIEELKGWYESLVAFRIKHRVNVIHQNISMNLRGQEDSFTYRAPNGSLYLVQNCRQPTLENALKIAQHWHVYHQNLGFETTGGRDIYQHIVWGLDKNFRIKLFFDYSGDDSQNYLQVLNYHSFEDLNNPNKDVNSLYAALLPLEHRVP